MAAFDYVILGAGAAGCVLANRLSANPSNEVLLIEAGGRDRSPYFHVPKIGAAMFGSERHAWNYPIEPFGPNNGREVWPRGKVVGGSTAINGMVYNRGFREDYHELERLGNKGWGWDHMLAGSRRSRTTSSVRRRPAGRADRFTSPHRATQIRCART